MDAQIYSKTNRKAVEIYMKNPISRLTKSEWALWLISLALVTASNIAAGKIDPITLSGTIIGVTALIFIAKGSVWGQILTVIFSIMYAVTSYSFRYYGEMITYLGMTMPMAALSAVSWLRHPMKEGADEVRIHRVTRREICVMCIITLFVTGVFYFILRWLGTANTVISTVSVTTSFAAAYLTFLRSPYYAAAYALNDIVLVALWVLASLRDISYLPMTVCFAVFLVNDAYGFVSWKRRQSAQERV